MGKETFHAIENPDAEPSFHSLVHRVVVNGGEGSGVKGHTTPKDIGYHAGDLGHGFDTVAGRMAGRSTGHFGTGVYFKSTPPAEGGSRDGRPVHAVDLSGYKLFKPSDEEQADSLHRALKIINNQTGYDKPDPKEIRQAAFSLFIVNPAKHDLDQLQKEIIPQAVADTVKEVNTKDAWNSNAYIPSASTRGRTGGKDLRSPLPHGLPPAMESSVLCHHRSNHSSRPISP